MELDKIHQNKIHQNKELDINNPTNHKPFNPTKKGATENDRKREIPDRRSTREFQAGDDNGEPLIGDDNEREGGNKLFRDFRNLILSIKLKTLSPKP